jgi:DNA-binding response OmpR family regulator
MHILVADNDPLSIKLTTFLLQSSSYTVSVANTGYETLEHVRADQPDLVILDIYLPDLDGFAVCRHIRQSGDTPILFLTASSDLADRVNGLQSGADDYLTKPYEPIELLARIEAVLRRHNGDMVLPLTRLRQGDLTLDPVDLKVHFRDGRSADLTPIEFRLLYYFMKNTGRVLSTEQILDKVWRYDDGNGNNLVAVYIRRLRSKIERDMRHPRYITTLQSLGYRFDATESASSPT